MITSRRGVHRGSISAGARQVGRSGSPAHLERSSRRSGGTFDRNLGEQVPGDARTHVADADGADSLHECRHLSRSSSQPSAATPSRRRSGNAAPSKDFPRRGDTTWPGNEPRTSSCDARADEPEQLRDLAVRPKHGDGHIRTVRIETPHEPRCVFLLEVPDVGQELPIGKRLGASARHVGPHLPEVTHHPAAKPRQSDVPRHTHPQHQSGTRQPEVEGRRTAAVQYPSLPPHQSGEPASLLPRRTLLPAGQPANVTIVRQELQIELGRDRPGQRGLPAPRANRRRAPCPLVPERARPR